MKGVPEQMKSSRLPEPYFRKGEKLLVTLDEVVNPRHTALVVVDVQNDFVYGRDRSSTPPGRTNPCERIIPPLNRFIDRCREIGVPVFYVRTFHGGDVDLPVYKARRARERQVPVCMIGSKGAEFPEKLNKPLPGEPIVVKHGYDAMADHDLNTILQNRGTRSLIFSGIDTAVCVDSTLRDAFHRGYYVVLAKDICGSDHLDRQEMAIQLIGAFFGLVATTRQIMRIWDKLG
jgi:ureidoacrylate peracid hydrolase